MLPRLFLARHGETTWSKEGRHTGRTDVPLSEQGELNARKLGRLMAGVRFSHVLASPRQRATRTCELAGLGAAAQTEADLAEWDYGDFEGLHTAEIQKGHPGWSIFRDGCPGGESPAEVSARADRLIARLRSMEGNIALFTHGHFGRVLAVRWICLPVVDGERLLIDTSSLGILAHEHQDPSAPVIALWNARPPGLPGQ
jgi:broad specificity phosphatase PhoE